MTTTGGSSGGSALDGGRGTRERDPPYDRPPPGYYERPPPGDRRADRELDAPGYYDRPPPSDRHRELDLGPPSRGGGSLGYRRPERPIERHAERRMERPKERYAERPIERHATGVEAGISSMIAGESRAHAGAMLAYAAASGVDRETVGVDSGVDREIGAPLGLGGDFRREDEEGQMQSDAIRCNQMQSDEEGQMQSDAIRCNQMQSDEEGQMHESGASEDPAGQAVGLRVPASPVEPFDEDDEGEQERNPRKRWRETERPVSEMPLYEVDSACAHASAAVPTGALPAAAAEWWASGETAQAPTPTPAAPETKVLTTAPEIKVRVYLPGCDTRIDVRLSLTVQQVIRWEQTKRRTEADAKKVKYNPSDVAAAFVQHVPMPLSRTFAELTEGSSTGPVKASWELRIEPIPIASPWGIEVCRRTLLLALAVAAAKVRGASAPTAAPNRLGVLSLKAVTANGFYLSLWPPPLRESELRTLATELRLALGEVISTEIPTRARVLLGPEAQARFQRAGLQLAEHMARTSAAPALVCDVAEDQLLLAHGSYTAFALPYTSDLRGSRLDVHPVASFGLFIHFAPPSLTLLPFGALEQRALLIAIGEIDDQSRLLQATSAAKLNELVDAGERACKLHIELAEAQLARRLSGFAERVCAQRPRLLLISAPPYGGLAWLAHALELQLLVRELRGVCIDAALWAKPAGGLRVADLRTDLATLFGSGRVVLPRARQLEEGGASGGGSLGCGSLSEDATTIELPAGGYVMLYGERLHEELQAATPEGAGVPGVPGAGVLDDLPKPHFRVQALPLCSVVLDEHACVGGGGFLLLRMLATARASGGSVVGALRAWGRLRPVERERASEHIDLTAVGAAVLNEWKPLNFSFAYELNVYAHLLPPLLRAVPVGDEIYAEARRVLDLLSELHAMPLEYVPAHSPVRGFCGGSWMPPRF